MQNPWLHPVGYSTVKLSLGVGPKSSIFSHCGDCKVVALVRPMLCQCFIVCTRAHFSPLKIGCSVSGRPCTCLSRCWFADNTGRSWSEPEKGIKIPGFFYLLDFTLMGVQGKDSEAF